MNARARAGLVAAPVALALGFAPAAHAADELRVASKPFTESVILGEIAALTASAAGAPARHQRALGGTRLCWNALRAGEIDAYPEYTGTLIQELLGGAAAPGADITALRAILRARGLGATDSLGFDNTYAIGMRAGVAARDGVATISDLRRHPALRFGFSNEFMSRRDGWPGLAARYGLPQTTARGLDHDLAYRGLADGSLDATDLYSTDAEIRRYDLRVLADDLRFFPRYEAVLLYRLDAEARWPAAVAALRQLGGRIDAAAMIAMNARAKLDKIPESTVAAAFLAASTSGSDGAAAAGRAPDDGDRGGGAAARARRIGLRAREHLGLVAVSLLAAILLAVPLGIVAARRPRLGQAVLAAVGVVQTIPSLALLVFMIPLLGIGSLPATAALFLYSLLPIVRNTHAGLRAIAPSVRDTAQALGLPPAAILWRIELPLALGTILAGIKSAAVINVGTATLGALIGAGGFGQPIFTGIRLDDLPLILEGALPASALALAVQGVFDVVDRLAVPRGLRL
ncbi:MAG TPA: glycine betaine ABC transporter substrate-binding protein [Polyangia bacterium]|nr:glycine betaine ABC transporter substrate-binding protein [Polyangia bacterium]